MHSMMKLVRKSTNVASDTLNDFHSTENDVCEKTSSPLLLSIMKITTL